MPQGFINVPGWGSWENAGGNAAVADLSGNGQLDLIVFQIDSPAGANRGLYRIGRDLDAAGTVTNGWSAWIEVPAWNSWENEGGGIAVASLGGAGQNDLIVFQIDAREGENRGLYSIGRNLDANGIAQGGWSAWREVPGWNSWFNQGGGIAVADLDGDGQMELLVFRIDNPQGRNSGLYCVGSALDQNGNVTGWSNWFRLPGWLSWENQGGGIAVADLDGNGRPELIVFQIDNPPGLNRGQYQIGWNLDANGRVTGDWSPWVTVPDWERWENAGGGIALASFAAGQRPKLVVFQIDDRPGENAGFYTLLDLEVDLDAAAQKGLWRLLPYDSQILPVHAALLHTGKVLFFAGSGNSRVRFNSPLFGDENQGIYTSVVWDFQNGNTFIHPPTLRDPANNRPFDFFCGGEAFLPDGKLLVAGGTKQYDNDQGGKFHGHADALLFDPILERWTRKAGMAHGRWYPTLLALGDSRVIAAAGANENGDYNEQLEAYDAAANTWTLLRNLHLPPYAHLFLLQDGRVFHSGGQMDTDDNAEAFVFPLAGNAVKAVNGLRDTNRRNQSASVLLPPAQAQRVLIMGGGPEGENEATNAVDLVDLTAANPQYQPAAPLHRERMHLNAVLLPDHTVLVCGGSGRRENAIQATLEAEVYDPQADQWTVLAAAVIPRMYHSVALLLPDGRVVAAGSNPDKGSQVAWEPPDPLEELRLELYSPAYLFKGPRPIITAAPQQCTYSGPAFSVQTPDAANIQWVSLIRPGVTTHSFNNEQRLVDLTFQVAAGGGALDVTVPVTGNIAPPGWYMLFLVNNAGVPSMAHWIHLQ
jgi:hypothetical protein